MFQFLDQNLKSSCVIKFFEGISLNILFIYENLPAGYFLVVNISRCTFRLNPFCVFT